MMEFSLTPGQEQTIATARRIGDKFSLEYWRALERDRQIPREFHVERLWPGASAFAIAPILPEMIRNLIATHDLGLPRSY